MKEMKNNATYIEYKGNKYEIVFDINVLESIQKEYGSFNKWSDLVSPSKKDEECDMGALKFGFCEALNEGIDIANEDRDEKVEFLTLKQVGRIITEIGLGTANAKLQEAVVESAKSDEKNE